MRYCARTLNFVNAIYPNVRVIFSVLYYTVLHWEFTSWELYRGMCSTVEELDWGSGLSPHTLDPDSLRDCRGLSCPPALTARLETLCSS